MLGPDEEDDEVAVDLGSVSALQCLAHGAILLTDQLDNITRLRDVRKAEPMRGWACGPLMPRLGMLTPTEYYG